MRCTWINALRVEAVVELISSLFGILIERLEFATLDFAALDFATLELSALE
jgi:hypothetical protein